jgi:tetratricopeptide (TPR) repeat protein
MREFLTGCLFLCLATFGWVQSPTEQDLVHEIQAAMKDGDPDRAMAALARLQALNPFSTVGRISRAMVQYHKGNYAASVAEATAALEQSPDCAKVLLITRGAAHGKLRDYPHALADLNRAIDLQPNHSEPYRERGKVYEQQGQHDRALADFNKAVLLNTLEENNYCDRADLHRTRGNQKQALSDYNQALELNPRMTAAREGRMMTALLLRDFDRCLADAASLLARQPNDPDVLAVRGGAHTGRGDFDKARADLDRAVALEPRNVLALIARGGLHRQRGDYSKACADFTRLIEVAPGGRPATRSGPAAWSSRRRTPGRWRTGVGRWTWPRHDPTY